MPDRILRAGIIKSDRVNLLSWPAEVFYRRLMSVVDDYGRYDGRTIILRSDLYPLKVDKVSLADVGKWKAECASAGLVSFYQVTGKEYLEIKDFGQRLRSMKSKWPAPADICQRMTADDSGCPPETEYEEETEIETEVERAKALPGARAPLRKFEDGENVLKDEFNKLEIPTTTTEAWQVVKDWISKNNPQFIEPYFIAWNIFATWYKLAKMRDVPASRRKKFNVRIKEKGFDFLEILAKAKASELLKSASWFSFDWLIENDRNYLKVLEGNYR